jgi:hypothetical protein
MNSPPGRQAPVELARAPYDRQWLGEKPRYSLFNVSFVAGVHFPQKPYTRFQLQNSAEVLLAL